MGCSSSAETNDDGSPRHIDGKNNAQSSAPVAPDIVCGYLKKEGLINSLTLTYLLTYLLTHSLTHSGAIFTTWKKRFFYLEAGKITYYESETPDKVHRSHTYLCIVYSLISDKLFTILPFYYYVHYLTFNSLIRVIQV